MIKKITEKFTEELSSDEEVKELNGKAKGSFK